MKNLFLRKIAIVAIAVVTISVSVTAQQKGDMAAGGNLVVGFGDKVTNIGIGGKFQYNVIDPLRLEGSITLFLPKTETETFLGEKYKYKWSMWDISVNAHYLFPVASQVTVYPLAGLGILGVTGKFTEGGRSYSNSESYFAFNLGGGVDFKLTDQIFLNSELKYKLCKDWDRFNFSVGVAFKF